MQSALRHQCMHSKASSIFVRPSKRLWSCDSIWLDMKIAAYYFPLVQIQHGSRPPSWKSQMTLSVEWVVQSTSCLILGAYCQQRANHIAYQFVCPSFCHVTLTLGGVNRQSLCGSFF